MKNIVLDILYPPVCPCCDTPYSGGGGVCPSCEKQLIPIGEPRCRCCSRPVSAVSEEYCPDCQNRQFSFEGGLACFPYAGAVREMVLKLKYEGRRDCGVFLGDCMAARIGPLVLSAGPLTLVPVPVHPGRRRIRGYNQAALLARQIARRYDLPMTEALVLRRESTRALKELGAWQRRESLRQAFYLNEKEPLPAQVLLVDDIYTTGATLDAIAAILKEGGVRQIWFATACIVSDL